MGELSILAWIGWSKLDNHQITSCLIRKCAGVHLVPDDSKYIEIIGCVMTSLDCLLGYLS